MHEGHEQGAVCARFNRNPFIGNRGVTRTYWIDGNKTAAYSFEFRERNLHWITVVILSSANHDEQLCVIQIGSTKFPKTAANGVNHSGSHIDGTKSAVRCIIRRAKLAGK